MEYSSPRKYFIVCKVKEATTIFYTIILVRDSYYKYCRHIIMHSNLNSEEVAATKVCYVIIDKGLQRVKYEH